MPSLTDFYDVVSRFDDRGLREAEMKALATAERIKRLQTTIGPAVNQKADDRLIREAIRNSDRMSKEQDRVARAEEKSTEQAVRLGKAITIAHYAAKSLAVAAAGVELQRAFDSGKIEEATAAIEKMKKAIQDLPIVGPASSSLSTIINDSGAFPFTKSLRDAVARARGKQTDDEVRATDEQEAKEKAAAEVKQKTIIAVRDQNRSSTELLARLKQEAELEDKTSKQRAAILAKRVLSAFDAQTAAMADVAHGGIGPQAAFSSERREARRALRARAIEADRQAEIEADTEAAAAERAAGEAGDKAVSDFFDELKAAAEREAARAREELRQMERAASIHGEATERDLRTAGHPGEAAAHAIERELKEALSETDSPELREALKENAESQLRALLPGQSHQVAGGLSAFDLNQTDLRRGNNDPSRETNDTLKNVINETLKRIEKNTANPPAALTS